MMVEGKVNATQAAGIIGCTPRYVRWLYRQGRIVGEQISPRVLLFDVGSVEAYRDKERHAGGRPRKPAAGPRGREEGDDGD